ncbi:hypothetical protein K458DRAFT_71815 [Lentithecium fluviatile CBS 122367]|uniref:Uncharacterized protein n=1 Tax=Lentithecium fluviatile CBS 122367 TaxID=1168545 RepID=A0A6G1IV11_9PLEO|nr:hypothetical protein K458DRAFT_71815 [Lentithecium fluviatile CBS 122367]
MSHVLYRMQSLTWCPNLLHLKQAIGVRRSSNGDTMVPPPPNVTPFDFSSFCIFLDRHLDDYGRVLSAGAWSAKPSHCTHLYSVFCSKVLHS